MARQINRLTPRGIAALKAPGLHADGGGLYLQIGPTGAKSWSYVFQWRGKRKQMGLGALLTTTLAEARQEADAARRAVARGINPIDVRRLARVGANTFGDVADDLVRSIQSEWKNEKHRYQWTQSLEVDACALRPLDVDKITTDDVLDVLRPIWTTKPETASRTRGRIERVLDAAKAKGLRTGDNPARWKGHLAVLLPKRQKLARGHHPAMPFTEIRDFMTALAARPALAARALELTILTACRTGEVIGAKASEFDLAKALWVIPAGRMKAKAEHRVPLNAAALAIVKQLIADQEELGTKSEYLFADGSGQKPISNMAMNMLLRRMGQLTYTVHGFRSTFRDWAGEQTDHPREVIEAALAHVVGSEVERAYRRGDALEKRRVLMADWAAHCGL
ncbi:integrase arm-type DNA-binding domain-containing protein [Roseibacterium beibuensis]|uniref:tyrosine-type recombinase/integrase n=1 Tax=[Roseibacterium] beibuensis TaxID=1193142 RepID=UPI00217E5D6E|nr:site-specific integrase [Roseibacterium beibuensis]MCS6625396.1 integrase arm-type DNA-binding domain-containing protein [Roseibacterium beibuensis]